MYGVWLWQTLDKYITILAILVTYYTTRRVSRITMITDENVCAVCS